MRFDRAMRSLTVLVLVVPRGGAGEEASASRIPQPWIGPLDEPATILLQETARGLRR
jgi:hypothetical protein